MLRMVRSKWKPVHHVPALLLSMTTNLKSSVSKKTRKNEHNFNYSTAASGGICSCEWLWWWLSRGEHRVLQLVECHCRLPLQGTEGLHWSQKVGPILWVMGYPPCVYSLIARLFLLLAGSVEKWSSHVACRSWCMYLLCPVPVAGQLGVSALKV